MVSYKNYILSLEVFKKKLGTLAYKYNEEELIQMKNDMNGLADLLFDDYFDKLKNKKNS